MESLDPRKAAILRAVVREYVQHGEPVGSKRIGERYRLKVSPATIRNDMAMLEELGFIAQPHTSAGRVPTDQGYRWFIDNWPGTDWPVLPKKEQTTIENVFRGDFGGLEEVLDSTSHLLSEVTRATALVVDPPNRSKQLRRMELIRRDDKHATMLLISDSGEVDQGVIEFKSPMTPDGLTELSNRLSEDLIATPFDQLDHEISAVDGITEEVKSVISESISQVLVEEGKVYRDGTANILGPDSFSDIEAARAVVDVLEKPKLLGSIVDSAQKTPKVVVMVGEEVPVEQMRACAVIFTSYESGDRLGALGVVGPTRMDYPHTISAVQSIAKSLSRLLDSLGA